MSKNMNEENEWDQIADAYTVDVPFESLMKEESMDSFKHLYFGTTPEPTEV